MISYADFLVPAASRTNRYDLRAINDSGTELSTGFFTLFWNLDSTPARSSDSDGNGADIERDENNLLFRFDNGDSVRFPVQVFEGEGFQYDFSSVEDGAANGRVYPFGPFWLARIVLNQNDQRDFADVIVTIEPTLAEQPGRIDVLVEVLQRGTGRIAAFDYFDCPEDLPLTPATDFGSHCAADMLLELISTP